ncbi:sensor histidine kinase [Halobacteriovorax sp. DPLXC-1]|uniref:sensor histidine kinase n=1 Tax=Halobacteriovorax sp. DPLXC-1 TaxID=3110771 RepID=UPI002FF0190F
MERKSNTSNSTIENQHLNIYLEKSILEYLNQDGLSNLLAKKNSQLLLSAKNNKVVAKINDQKFTLQNVYDLFIKIINTSSILENDFSKEYEFKKKDNLRTLVKSFTNTPELPGFSSSQVLIHEKGTTNIYSLSYKNSEYYESFEDPAFFNTLFTKVRKSKNKSFDQKELLNKHIKLDGHFLAKELSFRDFNTIFLLSRDDLFPLSDDDRLKFNNYIIKQIPKIFKIITSVSKKKVELEKANVINNFPIKTVIFNDEGNSITEEDLEAAQHDTSSLHHERILLMGELLNTLRHELSNPLFGIDLSHTLLMDQTNDFDVKDTLSHISNSVKRSQAIIQEFSNLYKDDEKLALISLKSLINETITLTKSESRAHRVVFEMENDIEIKSNGTLLSQVIFNLLINSSQALTNENVDNGKIEIKVIENSNDIHIDIMDNGNGIPENIKNKIFTPFFTTKETGTGLGLAICKTLLKKINGDINLMDVDFGAKFRLTLPKVSF